MSGCRNGWTAKPVSMRSLPSGNLWKLLRRCRQRITHSTARPRGFSRPWAVCACSPCAAVPISPPSRPCAAAAVWCRACNSLVRPKSASRATCCAPMTKPPRRLPMPWCARERRSHSNACRPMRLSSRRSNARCKGVACARSARPIRRRHSRSMRNGSTPKPNSIPAGAPIFAGPSAMPRNSAP